MSKLLKGKINLSNIKKEHLFKGEKGTWLDIDIWINDEPDKYGNIAGIKQTYKNGENYEGHFIGNAKEWKSKESKPAEKDDLPWN